MIPDFFTIIFDGWSCTREHYIALYASWTNAQGIVIRRLIACGVQPLPDVLQGETAEDFGFTAEDIGDYISYVLQMYDKSFMNIECIIGDNASVNRRLADLIRQWLYQEKNIRRIVPMLGDAAHKVNLAVEKLYGPATEYAQLVQKVHSLVVQLRSHINGFKISTLTTLNPILSNDTRWNSVYDMLERFLEMAPILDTCDFSHETTSMIPETLERRKITQLVKSLAKISSKSRCRNS